MRAPSGEKRGSDSSRSFMVCSAVICARASGTKAINARAVNSSIRRIIKTSMKQDAAFFEGKDPVLIYIAKKLKEALRLETALTEAGIDYGVEADEYRGGVVFRSARVGAFFYVLPEAVAVAHEAMLRRDFTPQVDQPDHAP
jgi:hypothetical protein